MARYTLYSVSNTVLGTADTLDKARAKAIKIIRERNPTGTGRFKQVDIWGTMSVGAVVLSKSKVTAPNPYFPVGQKFISFSWSPTSNDDVDYSLYIDGSIARRYDAESEGSSNFVYKGKKMSDQALMNEFKKTHIKV